MLRRNTSFPNIQSRRRKTGERGFTLIEIAIVLLIIAVIAAFVVPQVIHYIKMYRLGVASRNVATALQRARFLATSNNTRAGISIPELRRVEIEQYDLEGTADPQSKGTILLPDGITIASEAPRQIDFDGRGVVTPTPRQNQTIRVNGANGFYVIVTVSVTGQVTLSETLTEG